MNFQIIVSRAASNDVDRLEAWLLDKDPGAALRVGEVLYAAIASLEQMPERGRHAAATSDIRELNAKFGGATYVIRYQVDGRHVVVTRIFHGREQR